ncbi:MAG: peptide ABC transporter substrate-binding protein [Chloracidobacterium sp.]|nr:peptide ABC transporter substrate-binding protein [Chloracidobacterium sp.]
MFAPENIRPILTRFAVLVAACLLAASCSEIQRPKPEQYYGAAAPAPAKQEFRWSNGKVPRSLDPARAAAAPETDLVRAVYEGLTELDGRTLDARPALAEKWTASDENRVWTFELRKNARWTNGKRVTAGDIAASWQRVLKLGEKAPQRELFQNIVGTNIGTGEVLRTTDFDAAQTPVPLPPVSSQPRTTTAVKPEPTPTPGKPAAVVKPVLFGAEAVDDTTLKVTLKLPDKDLPKLVASTAFRPVYGSGEHFETEAINNGIVTNGPFRVALVNKDGVTLERSDTYWNKEAVHLDGVRFVAKETAESALDAYRHGELDAVTNAELEPLALKLLAPYEDFRQVRHSAINLYEVNLKNAPFSDRRVREALAIAIDRGKLIDSELEGATEPANTLLPLGPDERNALIFDAERARSLLETAGFPNGVEFPAIRLVVNRNDMQQRVARTIAQMWKQHLNIETQIAVTETAAMTAARTEGRYDLIRRGVVLPTADELAGLTSILGSVERRKDPAPVTGPEQAGPASDASSISGPAAADNEIVADIPRSDGPVKLITATEAMYDLTVIPLYFPVSYALVKPYVHGFELNGLDAFSLADVSIDSDWKPDARNGH